MNIHIIAAPFDTAYENKRMGAGPMRLIERGIEQVLGESGHTVQVEQVAPKTPFLAEIKTAFELYAGIAERVQAALSTDAFPLVLSGNCGGAIGGAAGLDSPDVGVIWFDCHGDFNTPDTTGTGFLDGMGLATITGRCWRTVVKTIPGYHPIPEANVIHVGARDLDPDEKALLDESEVTVVDDFHIKGQGIQALVPALDALRGRVKRVYIHVDMDVLDSSQWPANPFPAPGGLTPTQVTEAIAMIGERFEVGAAGVASYDPSYDREERTLKAAFDVIKALVADM
jgi:arginase